MNKQSDEEKADLMAFAERLNQALDNVEWIDEAGNVCHVPPKGKGRHTEAAKLFERDPKAVRRWVEGLGWPRRKDFPYVAEKVNVSAPWLFLDIGNPQDNRPQNESRSTLRKTEDSIAIAISKAEIEAGEQLTFKLRIAIIAKLIEELKDL